MNEDILNVTSQGFSQTYFGNTSSRASDIPKLNENSSTRFQYFQALILETLSKLDVASTLDFSIHKVQLISRKRLLKRRKRLLIF